MNVSGSSPSQNILLVHEVVPHYDCGGADLRLFELVREMQLLGHRVTLLARDGHNAEKYKPAIEAFGTRVVCDDPERLRHCGRTGQTKWSLEQLLAQGQFHMAILSQWFWSGISVSEHYLDEIRTYSPETRILILSEDRHGERERRSWKLTGLLSDWERGNDYEQREVEVYQRADLVLYVTKTDQQHFLSLLPHLKTAHLSTIAEVKTPGGPREGRDGLLFLANFDNLANQDALQWLLQEIWPRIREADPEITLYLAGHGTTKEMAKGHANVSVLGKIDDLGECFRERCIFVSPIRFGTGIITKNMIAIAHGLPTVTTTVGAEGLQLRGGVHALIADSPQTFAESALRLYRDVRLWTTISETGREYIRKTFSLENLRAQIRDIVALAPALTPQPAEQGHVWSYRAIEQSHLEAFSQGPVRYRAMLVALAYQQRGRQFLWAGQTPQALEQFRHIFTNMRGRLLATVFHSALLRDLKECYRILGDAEGVSHCVNESQQIALPWKTPMPELRPASRSPGKHRGPEVSVIIPTFNRKETLRLCLSALAFQSLPAERWEIIVVDDGSTDGTDSFCRDLVLPSSPVRYIRQNNKGAGAARHRGVEEARGEFLVFFNDDTVPGSSLLAEHLNLHRRNPREKWAVLGAFTPSQDCVNRALSMWVNHSTFLFPQHSLQRGALYDEALFVTCNLSIRRDAVLAAGSFDPHFRVAEDTELGARLVKMGYRIKYHPEAEAIHEHSTFTTADLLRRARAYGAADWLLFQKHPHLLRSGTGPFGRLEEADYRRIRILLAEKEEAVRAGVAALEALDNLDLLPLYWKNSQGVAEAEQILSQLNQFVPLVYWHHLFRSFLDARQEGLPKDETSDKDAAVPAS